MNNFIKYYYGLDISDLHKTNNEYSFFVGEKKYLFLPFYGNLKQIYDIYLFLNENKRYCHEIINTKNNESIINYNGELYILLKCHIDNNDAINIMDILNYTLKISTGPINWKQLWEKKIDYYEYQISQVGKNFPLIRESFSYFIGLSENAIQLLNEIDLKKIDLYVSHKRIDNISTLINFYNPQNFIIDSRVRDIAEYFKSSFFNKNNNITVVEEVFVFLSEINYNYVEVMLFFIRLLYPSYYFDLYDLILSNKKEEKELVNIINKVSEYEKFLVEIYNYINSYYPMPQIEWLIKKSS